MNLDELQIKISIELNELNKQLKTITRDIDKALGPKTTKKLMDDNNKVIKSGLTAINKTTLNLVKKSRKDTTREVEAMSKDINKSLNKAFDINLTSFNSNITSAMNQARATVRSACNDIRRELNAALNFKGSIRVTSKASISGSVTGSSDSNVASNMASSQYIGAMIIKATNAILKAIGNNTIQIRLEIGRATDRIVSAIKNIKLTESKTQAQQQQQRQAQNQKNQQKGGIKTNTTTGGKTVGQPYGPDSKSLANALKNIYKAINILNKNLSALNSLRNARQLGNGSSSYGHNSMQSWTPGTRYQKAATSFEGEVINPSVVPIKVFEQLESILEVIDFKVKDINDGLVSVGRTALSVSKALGQFNNLKNNQSSQPLKGEVINANKPKVNEGITQKEIIIPVEFKVIDDELLDIVNKTFNEIKKSLEVIYIETGKVNFNLGEAGNLITAEVDRMRAMHNAVKALGTSNINFDLGDTKKQLTDVVELMKKIFALRNGLVADTTSFILGEETSESHTGSVKDASKPKERTKGITQKEVIIPVEFKVIDDELKEQVDKAVAKIKQVNLDIPIGMTSPKLNEPDNSNPQLPQLSNIQLPTSYDFLSDNEIQAMNDAINDMEFSAEKANAIMEALRASFITMVKNVRDIAEGLKNATTEAGKLNNEMSRPQAPQSVKNMPELEWQDVDPEPVEASLEEVLGIVNNVQEELDETSQKSTRVFSDKFYENMEKSNQQFNEIIASIQRIKDANDFESLTSAVAKLDAKLEGSADSLIEIIQILDIFSNTFNNLNFADADMLDDAFNSLDRCKDVLRQLSQTELPNTKKAIDKLAESFSDSNIDTSAITKLRDKLISLQQVRNKVAKIARGAEVGNGINENDLYAQFRATKDAGNVSFGEGGPDSLGFSAFKAEIDALIEYAKKAGAKIKKALFGSDGSDELAISIDVDDSNLNKKLNSIRKTLGSTTKGENNIDFTKATPKKKVTRENETVVDSVGKTLKEDAQGIKQTVSELIQIQKAMKNIPKLGDTFAGSLKADGLGVLPDNVDDLNKKVQELKDNFANVFSELQKGDTNPLEAKMSIDEICKQIEALRKQIDVIENDPLNLNVDSDKIEDAKRALKDLLDLQKDYNSYSFKTGGYRPNMDDTQLETYQRRAKHAGKVKYGEADSGSLGFLAYQQQLIKLQALAKKVFGNIRKFARVAFNPTQGPAKLHSALTRIEKKAINVFNNIRNRAKTIFSKVATPLANSFNRIIPSVKKVANKISTSFKSAMSKTSALTKNYSAVIKSHLNKAFTGIKSTKLYTSVASGLGRAKSAISKFSASAKSILNKAFKGIKVGSSVASNIRSGLSKAKGALQKFASGCKSLWSKIKQIFHKGSKDATKATGKLKTGLKDLLKQALSFISLYSLISLGKQAIEQSQTLAQAEVKLASLMKQRMGATKETVLAIRQLAEEQAKLGVVSETAMKNGAQQLAMYVHSAKALETLMPAIANLTAKRGGFNATPEDAEEVATQLGEAIREGTTTPLEQSGIYLSESEIKKFQALRTEEERAAYLANVVAKNVGNINEALANTPHGAISQLKNNFQSLLGTLGIFLANVIKPIVQWLNYIVVACNNALKALGNLLGFDMTGGALTMGDLGTGGGVGGGEIDTGGIDNTTDAYKDAADAADEATEANEKFKGSLMGFDEINVLSDNTSSSDSGSDPEDDPTNITPGEGGQLIPEVGELTEGEGPFDKFAEKMKAFMNEVLEPFKNAWAELGDRWKQAWADLVESFKNSCDSLATFLKSVWDNGGKEFVQHMAEIGLACGIAAMEIGGTILDALAELWRHLDPSTNMNTQGFLDALNEVSVKLRDFILSLNGHLENLLEYGGQDLLNAMGDCFMNLGEAAVRAFGVIIDALDGLLNHLDASTNVNTQNFLKAWTDAFHAIGKAALDFVELLESSLVNGGQDMINAFGDMVMKVGQSIGENITTIMTAFSNLFDYLDPATNEITKNMMKSWEDAFNAIGDAALSFSSLLKSTLENGGQDVINTLADAFNSLIGLVGDIVKEIADALNGLFDHLDPATNQFTKDMLSAWEEAFKGISEMCKSFSGLISDTMDNGGQEIVNSLGDLAMKVAETVGVVISTIADTFAKLFDHMNPSKNENSKDMLKSLDGLVDSITKCVDAIKDAFKRFMDNGGQEFINNIGDIIAILVDLAATLGSGIIDLVTSFLNSFIGQAIIEGIAQALAWLTEKLVGLKDAIEVVKDIFQNIIDIIVGIFEGDGEKVGKAFADLVKNAFKLTGELLQWIWDVAGDLVEGLVKGICALPGLLWEAVKFLFDTIISFFKELFGIHSPSTVFSELGENLIEGLVEGIKSMFNSITEALGELGDTIFGWIEDLLGKVAEGWENLKETASKKWGEIKETVSEKCEEIYKDTKETYEDIKTNVTDKLENLHKNSEDKWNKIKEKTNDLTSKLKSEIEDRYTKFKDALTNTMDKWRQNSEEKWTKIKDKTNDLTTKLRSEVEDRYNKFKETLTNTMDKWRQNSEEKWTKIKDKTNDLTTKLRSDVEERYTKFKDALTDTMEKWRANNEDKWSKIKAKSEELSESLKSKVEDKYNKFKDNLTNTLEKLRSNSEDKWNKVKSKTEELVGSLKSSAESKYEEFKNNVTSKLENLRSESQNKWENIKSKTDELVNNLKSEAEKKYGELKTNLSTKLEEVKNDMSTKWTNIKSDTSTKVKDVVSEATTKFNDIKGKFTTKMDELKSALGPKWDTLKSNAKTNAEGMVTKVSDGLRNLKTTMTKPFEDAKSAVEKVIEKIGNCFKNADWSFPKIKLPHLKITGKWSFNPPSVPSFGVEWYKRGGIIDGITPLGFANGSLHMGGEAGSELVMPLENTSFTSKIAMALGQAVDNALAKQSNPYNQHYNAVNDNRDIVLQINDREFARASINSINKLQRESGRTLLNI